jgi:hypothetical protein
MSQRTVRCEIAPGILAHKTTDPKRGICDDCGADMRLEPMKPCRPKEKSNG